MQAEDPRAVVNELLAAGSAPENMSNLVLQKVVYFLNGQYLISTGRPLVSGYFEAWEFGPVHPLLYGAMRHLRAEPLKYPLKRRAIHTGEWEEIPSISDENVRAFVRAGGVALLKLSPSKLVDLSHAPKSPWDIATRCGNRRSWGARLDNNTISKYFQFHKRSLSDSADGDSFEEHPPSGN